MTGLKDRIREAGGLVGHIKASVSTAAETTMLSLTKDSVNRTAAQGGRNTVCFAAIVIAVDEEWLEEQVEAIYDLL